MAEAFDEKSLRAWLETPAAQGILEEIAESVLRDLMKNPAHFVLLFPDLQPSDSRKEMITVLQSELNIFILKKFPILRADHPNLARYLHQSFLNEMRSRLRSPDKSPFAYFYKRVTDLLRSSDRFAVFAQGKRGSFFSRDPDGKPTQPLSTEDLASIPFPRHLAGRRNFESINQKKTVLEMADHFLDHVSGIFGEESIRVAIRDFVQWVGLHVPLNFQLPEPAYPDGNDRLQHISDVGSKPDPFFLNPEQIRGWAEKFSNLLEEKEKTILYLRYGCGKNLKEIAQSTEYRSESGPSYVLENSKDKLRKFLIDLPGLSPDDLNEEAFSLFWDTLLVILKKSRSTS